MSATGDQSHSSRTKLKPESYKTYHGRDPNPGNHLWTDGLICAFEFVRGKMRPDKSMSSSEITNRLHFDSQYSKTHVPSNGLMEAYSTRSDENKLSHPSSNDDKESSVLEANQFNVPVKHGGDHWVPIGWARISELVQAVQVDAVWSSHQFKFEDSEDDFTVADLAGPYWESPDGPIWWCHVSAGHPSVEAWLSNAQWLHPAVSLALRDESRLISERMKHLFYEVPVRVAGGLLFELLGQSVGDPLVEEDDIPIVLRSWQAQNFLVTVMHIKGSVPSINVLGIREVQELLSTGGYNVPRTAHEVRAQLAFRLSRWDDRLFRKSIFGTSDEIELKFMNRKINEDMNLLIIILNQEIRKLSTQVIRVKWSLHARDEIIIELLQHLKGNVARNLLEEIKKSTREMIEEQEEVRGRLFTIQDVMQSTLRAWLQDKSLTVTHYLAVFGGVACWPCSQHDYWFIRYQRRWNALVCLVFLGPRKPAVEEHVEARKLELQELVKYVEVKTRISL
ncbi:Magnesium transporter CorA family protein [Trifolium repens]|nr:Magnesium transporter CorA family protein [Trifolium repens]